MTQAGTPFDPRSLKPGDTICGFAVDSVCDLPEIDGQAFLLHHGFARTPVLWLANEDTEKSFAISFATPAADDTGVFHILEHSVLCGSERYPVKEPFVHLLKSSMQTFLNAMTFPDKTVYPVASTNEQDLLNLMGVYLDAVFNPLLYRKQAVFEQEGWHYELEDAQAPLTYNGVVFNEMKGVMANAESVASYALMRALFPNSTYGHVSGGDPRAIPQLSYAAYKDAHTRHYHPSNALVVLYGNISLEPELKLLGSQYLAQAAMSTGKPNTLEMQAPVEQLDVQVTMDTAPEQAMLMLGLVNGTYEDVRRGVATGIVLSALTGSNEAPLKKRMLEEGLGSDISFSTVNAMLQPLVVVQVDGADLSRKDASTRFLELLRSHVQAIADEGIPRGMLEAALASTAFQMRESNFGLPDGIWRSLVALRSWHYDARRALDGLRYEEQLAWLHDQLETDYYEQLLREIFLENPHRALVTLTPEPGYASSPAAQERAELEQRKATLTSQEIQDTIAHAQELAGLQMADDAPEAVLTLPVLSRSDLGDGPTEPAYGLVEGLPSPTLYHSVETRRIDYVSHYFDLNHLTFDELSAVNLLCQLFGRLDTAQHSASELDVLLEARLGNFSFTPRVFYNFKTGTPQVRLCASAAALEENLEDLAALPYELWSSTNFDAPKQIRTWLNQSRLGLEQSFIHSGHVHAMTQAMAAVSPLYLLDAQLRSVHYYRYICSLLENYEQGFDALVQQLQQLAGKIFRPENLISSFTGTRGHLDRYWDLLAAQGALAGGAGAVSGNSASSGAGGSAAGSGGSAPAAGPSLSQLAATGAASPHSIQTPEPDLQNRAFVIPGSVGYVARSASQAMTGARHSGTWDVASNILNLEYLWNEVRVRGGAYGVGFRMRGSGAMCCYSYRDPRLDETLERYGRMGSWLEAHTPDQRSMDGFVISTVATHDEPVKPAILAGQQDGEFLMGRTPEDRARLRQEKLNCLSDELKSCVEPLKAMAAKGVSCVFAPRETIEASKTSFEVCDILGSNSNGGGNGDAATGVEA